MSDAPRDFWIYVQEFIVTKIARHNQTLFYVHIEVTQPKNQLYFISSLFHSSRILVIFFSQFIDVTVLCKQKNI